MLKAIKKYVATQKTTQKTTRQASGMLKAIKKYLRRREIVLQRIIDERDVELLRLKTLLLDADIRLRDLTPPVPTEIKRETLPSGHVKIPGNS
jgi:hypothetical protein